MLCNVLDIIRQRESDAKWGVVGLNNNFAFKDKQTPRTVHDYCLIKTYCVPKIKSRDLLGEGQWSDGES